MVTAGGNGEWAALPVANARNQDGASRKSWVIGGSDGYDVLGPLDFHNGSRETPRFMIGAEELASIADATRHYAGALQRPSRQRYSHAMVAPASAVISATS